MRIMSNRRRLLTATALGFTALAAFGFIRREMLIQEYSLTDPKGVNGFSFALLDGVEPVFGTGGGVKGTVQFDVENPEKSKGSVEIDMKTLRVTSDGMTQSMLGPTCLDITKYPTAKFVVSSAKITSKEKDGTMVGTLTGDLTIKDVTKTVTVKGKAKLVPGGAKIRFGNREGDLLLLSSDVEFDRHEYNVAKEMNGAVISTRVQLKINCAAVAFK